MRMTVVGVVSVIGGVLLLAVVAYALLGTGPTNTEESNEQPNLNR